MAGLGYDALHVCGVRQLGDGRVDPALVHRLGVPGRPAALPPWKVRGGNASLGLPFDGGSADPVRVCVVRPVRSGGTLVFDAIIFFQFWRYRYSRYRELQDLDAIENAQSKG